MIERTKQDLKRLFPFYKELGWFLDGFAQTFILLFVLAVIGVMVGFLLFFALAFLIGLPWLAIPCYLVFTVGGLVNVWKQKQKKRNDE